MTGEGFAVVLVLLVVGGIAARILIPKITIEPGRVIRSNPFTDERLRQAVIRDVKALKLGGLSREDAQKLIEEVSRHSLAKEYANIYRGMKVEVTENWPDAVCIISGNIAVIELWVGHSVDGEGIKPVTVDIQRQAELKLDGKKPIREAFDELYELPPKVTPVRSQAVAQAPKASPQVSTAPPKATRKSKVRGR